MSDPIDSAEAAAIVREVITAVNYHTYEDVDPELPYTALAAIELIKDLGIAPNNVMQLAVPLTKISRRHGGRAIGPFDVSRAESVQDLCSLVIEAVQA